MLLREQGGRYQDRHLLLALYRDKGRAQGNFGFAKTHIAADDTVHRLAGFHIFQHGVYGCLLIRCFLVLKSGAEVCVHGFVKLKTKPLPGLSACI